MATSSYVERGPELLLHGHLIIHIDEASSLPNMENWYTKVYDRKDVSDPFVDVKIGKATIAQSKVILNNLNPVWNETFRVEVCHRSSRLEFDIRDKDHAYSERIGLVNISVKDLIDQGKVEGWFPISKEKPQTRSRYPHLKKVLHGPGKSNQVLNQDPYIKLSIGYFPVNYMDVNYEVDSYFPVHHGCHVTLYQDAACPSDNPHLGLVRGPFNVAPSPQSCWRDLYFHIQAAKTLICITGWAFWTQLKLLRGEEAQSIYNGTLGELLVQKADKGVKVHIMVWDEFDYTNGMFGTHDTETYNFFKHATYKTSNKVLCVKTPRQIDKKTDLTHMLQNHFASASYTHHQKSVILDSPNPHHPEGKASLVAFVGGLDLNDGRYDTPDHPLFSTLKTDHAGDFRNKPDKSTPPDVGPREPWHDIHCKLEGPVTLDVLENFIERWNRQALNEGPPPVFNAFTIDPMVLAGQHDQNREWNCQFFRSITNDSAVMKEDRRQNLVLTGKKGRVVDQSIATTYVNAIRSAKNFIYIENQYFMGSSFAWAEESNDVINTIPVEIVAKIIAKIRAGQRFSAYIVIPMFPEGDPSSAGMQSILHWQKLTMEMMYKQVGDALAICNVGPNLGQDPTDWLVFLCLGKREVPGPHMDVLENPREGTLALRWRETMRFMIYVHSKMMIVDDSYIIVGSANINDRSFAGTRDTEMAVGSWQPQFTAENPYGEIHMFRMSLWAEHLKTFEEIFKYPGALDCISRIKEMASTNWEIYNYEHYGRSKDMETPGHLLSYPVRIQADGTLENLENFTNFPDFPQTAKVFGAKKIGIRNKVTT